MARNTCTLASALLASSCLTIAAPIGAWAQTAAPAPASGEHANILEEVVVTSARQRQEDVQTTPVAVTALNQELLERAHVTNFTDLTALAPNLHIARSSSAGTSTVYLRGFGAYTQDPSVDPHVATFIDGIYQPALSGTLLDMFDLAQVEVQGGPQGTLLGKNAPIGAVYIKSAKPTGDFSGEVEGDYGSYDHFGGRAKINFPIIQDADGGSILAGRVSFVEKEGGNWIYNQANGKRDEGGENDKLGRISLAFTPSPDFEWDLTGSLLMQRDPQTGVTNQGFVGGRPGTSSSGTQAAQLCTPFPGGVCPVTPYGTTDSNYTTRMTGDQVQVSSTMAYQFTPVTLTAVTGYVSQWIIDNDNSSGSPTTLLDAFNDRIRYDEETQEVRLSSRKGGGWDFDNRLDWVVGGYFSNFQYSASQNVSVLNLVPVGEQYAISRSIQTGTTQSEAVFGHFIYNFTDQWTGTFGVRQSWDQKNHAYQSKLNAVFLPDIPAGFHNTSFEAGTAYQFDEDRMAYVRFAQGYEGGGYGGFAHGNIYGPETNNAYEVGFKSDWLDKRLRVNLDFFLNELSDLQVKTTIPIPTSPFFLQEQGNAGSATVEGMEAQIIAVPTDDLTTHLTLGYLHPKYNKYFGTACSNTVAATDCSGIPFGNASKWTINLGGDYVMDLPNNWGTATFSADWDYRSSVYVSDPAFPSAFEGGYGLVNAGLKFDDPSEKYSIEFYGTNILDRRYKTAFSAVAGGLAEFQTSGRPAEWGLRLTGKFGGPSEAPEPMTAAPATPVAAPAPAPAPAPVQKVEVRRQFQVFFDFDKSDITEAAAGVIRKAADSVKAGNVTAIEVTGHTDTVGSAAYNQKLSERRADAVKAALVADGVADGEIATSGVGKTGLLVPTGDGVREPQNRRAQIELK